MNENEIILDNIMNDVMDNIRQLKTKKSTFGGYDRESVMNTIQDICNNYERHISKIFADNKDHFDMLNAEINDLRQKNEILSRRAVTEPAVISKANQAIAEANSTIEAANQNISKLQALYEAAEAKLREQEGLIAKMSEEIKEKITKKNEDVCDIKMTKPAPAPQQALQFQQNALNIPQPAQNAPNPYYNGQPYYGSTPFYAAQQGFVNQPFYDAQQTPSPAEAPVNPKEKERREALSHSQPIIDEAKKAAKEIIKGANEEAERLRQLARSEAEAIVRDRRAELRAEEKLHEELLGQLKEKYSKYSSFFSKMVEGVKSIDSFSPPVPEACEPALPEEEVQDTVSLSGWEGSFPNQGFVRQI